GGRGGGGGAGGGGGPAQAADRRGARGGGGRSKARKVGGRRGGEAAPPRRDRRQADVREGGERYLVDAHRLERPQRGLEAGAVVRAERREAERPQPLRGIGGGDAAECLCVLVERQQGDAPQRPPAPTPLHPPHRPAPPPH